MSRAGGPFSGYSCDIWAAGVCLWVFIFGSLPFMEDSPDDLFDRIVEGDLVWPERVRFSSVFFSLHAAVLRDVHV